MVDFNWLLYQYDKGVFYDAIKICGPKVTLSLWWVLELAEKVLWMSLTGAIWMSLTLKYLH